MKKMKSISFVFGLLVITVLAFSAMAQDVDNIKYPKLNKFEIPEIERITLDNGIRLYLIEDKALPVFRISTRINCGSHLESADKVGLASICGTVMRTGGTSKWSGDEIDEKLEAIGGAVETSIGMASGNAAVDVLSDYTELGIEVLADILRNPQFEQDKIDLAKVQERSGISRRNDDAQGIAFREYVKVIYGAESPYARHSEYATINAIERADLVEYHGKWFKPQNIQMAIWGDYDKEELLALLNKYFGDWKKDETVVPPLPKVDYKFDNQVYYINKPDVNQTNVVIGHIGGLVTDADYGARIVMNNILGGGFGSRMFNNVRSKEGLAYATFGVYSANISHPGVFYNFASTKSETTVKAAREIIKQIKGMQTEPITEDEMRMGKDGYLNSFVFNFDTKSEVVNRLMNYDFYGLPDDHLFKVKDDVEKVDPDAVIKAAVDNLRPDALRMVVVGNVQDFELPLDQAGLGPVSEIDITIPSGEEKKELAVTPENLEKGMALLTKAVEVSGGLDNYKKIESLTKKGQYLLNTPQGEFPLAFESVDVLPDKSRSVVSMMGQTIYDIRNGNTGWKTGQAGLVEMTEDDIVKANKNNERNTILIFKQVDAPEYQAVYDGAGEVEGQAVEFVALLDKKGESICRLGFGADGSLVSKSYWGETPMGEGDVTDIFGEMTDVSGIKVPFNTIKMLTGQQVAKIVISDFVINGEIAGDAFNKPE